MTHLKNNNEKQAQVFLWPVFAPGHKCSARAPPASRRTGHSGRTHFEAVILLILMQKRPLSFSVLEIFQLSFKQRNMNFSDEGFTCGSSGSTEIAFQLTIFSFVMLNPATVLARGCCCSCTDSNISTF